MSDTSISVKVKNCFYHNFSAFFPLTKFRTTLKWGEHILLCYWYLNHYLDVLLTFKNHIILLKNVLYMSGSTMLGFWLDLHNSFTLNMLYGHKMHKYEVLIFINCIYICIFVCVSSIFLFPCFATKFVI